MAWFIEKGYWLVHFYLASMVSFIFGLWYGLYFFCYVAMIMFPSEFVGGIWSMDDGVEVKNKINFLYLFKGCLVDRNGSISD